MVRSLTSSAITKKSTALGTTPIVVIKVEWSSGTAYYADQAVSLTGISASAAILDFSSITAQGTTNGVGEMSSASVLLDDTSGALKTIVNNDLIENTAVTIYQHFDGNSADDLIVLLKGRIISEVTWSEGERTLGFEVETYVENNEVGYAPDEDDIENISPNAVDVPWPLGFGTVLKVPAVRVRRQPTGTLSKGANVSFSVLNIDGGDTFPQGTTVRIKVANILYDGVFNGSVFTVEDSNIAQHASITFASRPGADPNYLDANVAWISTDDNIKGLYCWVDHAVYGAMVNRVDQQEGRKCYFAKPWRPNNTTLKVVLSSNDTIEETATYPRSSWGLPFFHESIVSSTNSDAPRAWGGTTYYRKPEVVGGVYIWGNTWSVFSGAPVRLVSSYDDLYVFNLLPSLEVLEVYGYQTIGGIKTFVPIPSTYYTKYLSATLGPKTCSYLTMSLPLEDRVDEGWDGNVYVSYRSTVGPNGTDIVSHLLTNYTNITADSTTFAAVRPKILHYWANFVVFDQPEALSLIEQIVWQLRCALMLRNGVAYVKYLSEVPTTDATITEASALLKTVQLGFTSTESIKTKINSVWHTDYSGRPESEYTYVYKNNVNTFGASELDLPITIYNNKEFVEKTVAFWGYRYSNVWRKVSLQTVLEYLELEAYDAAALSVPAVSTNTLRGILEQVTQDTDANTITMGLTLASRSGESTAGQPIEDLYYWAGDPANPIISNPVATDPGTGRGEVEYVVPTSGQTTSDPNSDTTSSATDDPPAETSYFLVFSNYPESIERGVNFLLTVQVQDNNGQLVQKGLSATISIVSSDGSDVFNKSNITIANGTWSASDCQITGGSGSDSVDFNIGAADHIGIPITGVPIGAAKTSTLSWDTSPASATRGTAFSVALSGASAAAVLAINLNSTDPNDKLYDASGLVTSITCDGSGNYSAADWYVQGGYGSDAASLTASSSTYSDESTSQFTVSGSSPHLVAQTIGLTQETSVNPGSFVITAPLSIADGEPFELTVTAWDNNSNIDTSWDKTLKLVFLDVNEEPVNWADVGPDASITENKAIVNMVDGLWSFGACKVTYSETTAGPLELLADSPYPIATRSDSIAIGAGPDVFAYMSSPAGTQREVNFTLTVEIRDAEGGILTTLAPDCTLTLSGAHASDVLNKTTIATGEWSSGVWTNTTMQITGGTGSLADATITITDDLGTITEAVATVAIYVTSTPMTLGGTKYYYAGSDVIAVEDSYSDQFNAAQANAYVALLGSSEYTTTATSYVSHFRASYKYGAFCVAVGTMIYNAYGSLDTTSTCSLRGGIGTYAITAGQVADSNVQLVANLITRGFYTDAYAGGFDNHPNEAYRQGSAALRYGYTKPTSYSEMLAGTSIQAFECDDSFATRSCLIPHEVLAGVGSGGGTLYLWMTHSTHTVYSPVYADGAMFEKHGYANCYIDSLVAVS